MTSLEQLEQLLLDQPPMPPVASWHPMLSGDMDMRIDVRGDWYHEGTLIQRQPLVNLFASILRREDDGDYYLLTPVEKWRIQVEDAPLLAVDVETAGDGKAQKWVFTLNTGERLLLDQGHPITIRIGERDCEPRPYLMLDRGLSARLTRALFYRLVDAAGVKNNQYGIYSAGHWFAFGDIE